MNFHFKKFGVKVMGLFLVLSFIFPPMAVFAEDVTRSPYDPALTAQENSTPSSDSGSGSNFAGNTAKGVVSCGAGEAISSLVTKALSSVTGAVSGAISSVTGGGSSGGGGNAVPVSNPPIENNTSSIKDSQNTFVKKEFSLDCIARELARAALREMTDSLVGWINGGFEGSPLFLEDPMAFFQGIEDSVSGILLKELGLTRLCSLSANDLKLALGLDFGARRGIRERYACTLRDLEMNVDEIFNDLSSRSLQDYLDVTVNPNNNFWGAYLGLSDEMNRTIESIKGEQKDQLNQSGGFLSAIGIDGKIVTPGKVIEDQLSNVLGSEVRQLELADEINEVVAALINALINKVMSAGKGLRN